MDADAGCVAHPCALAVPISACGRRLPSISEYPAWEFVVECIPRGTFLTAMCSSCHSSCLAVAQLLG